MSYVCCDVRYIAGLTRATHVHCPKCNRCLKARYNALCRPLPKIDWRGSESAGEEGYPDEPA